MNNFKQNFSNIVKQKKWIGLLLIALFVVQFIINFYFNVNLIGNHMGYDSSWSYLKASLIWNEKALNSDIWVDQTSVFLDSSMTLAALLYGITGNLLVSYGVANEIVLVLVLLCIYSILNRLNINLEGKFFALNLVICPYLTNGFSVGNDLGYFNDLISGPAFYSLRALIVLLIVREFLVIRSIGKIDIFGYVSLFLCALAGASSGIFIIVMILLPYMLYEIECMFIKNNYKVLLKVEALYCYLGVILVFCGKIFAEHVLKITAIDASRTWTPLSKLWTNIGAPFLGLMKLLGVLPVEDTSISVLTEEGIYRLFPLFIFFVLLLSIVFAIKKISKGISIENGFIHFCINTVGLNFLIFGLFNAQYGSALFEERYLICTYMIVVILMSYYFQNIDKTLIFTQIVTVMLLVSLIGNDYVSDKKYVETTNESWQMAEIKEVVNSENAELVYFWGDEVNAVGRAMRVYDTKHVYKEIESSGGYHHWGDYKYYEDNGDYTGSTILIIPKGSGVVPDNILSQYTLIHELDWVSIYKCEYNPIDMVAGFMGDVSVDYPSTPGMNVQYGIFEGNSYISDGTAGYVMWGPYCSTNDGIYDFVLDYEIIEGGEATFDISIDNGTVQLGTCTLRPDERKITLPDIATATGHTLEYRIMCGDGTKIRINKVTILRK